MKLNEFISIIANASRLQVCNEPLARRPRSSHITNTVQTPRAQQNHSKETMDDWLANGVPEHIYKLDPEGFAKKGIFETPAKKETGSAKELKKLALASLFAK